MKTDTYKKPKLCLSFPFLLALFFSFQGFFAIGQEIEAPKTKKRKTNPDEVIYVVGKSEVRTQSGSAHLMDQEDLKKMNYTDITRILREVPGVNIREEEGYGLRVNIGIRGANPNRSKKVVLLEDGVLIAPAPYAAPAAYYFPLVTRLEAVEVFKGPAAIPYGPNNIGGAVNVVTRRIPDINEGAAEIELGSYGFRKAQTYYGGNYGAFSGLLDIATIGSDGFSTVDDDKKDPGFLGAGKDNKTGFVKNDVLAKLRYTHDTGSSYQHFLLKGGFATESADATYFGVSHEDFAKNPYKRYAASADDHIETIHHQVSLEHFYEGSSGVTALTTYYNHYYYRDWDKYAQIGTFGGEGVNSQPNNKKILFEPEGFEKDWLKVLKGEMDNPTDYFIWMTSNARNFRSKGLQQKINFDLGSSDVLHDIEVGLRLHEDYIDKNQEWTAYDMRDGKLVLRDWQGYVHVQADDMNTAKALSTYVLDNIKMGSLTVSPGVRYENIETRHTPGGRVIDEQFKTEPRHRTNELVSPGIGFFYQMSPHISLLSGAHKGYTTVSPQEAKAEVEESINYEAGVRSYYKGLTFDLIGFYSDYDNLKGSCSQSSGCDSANMGKDYDGGNAVVSGLENSISYDFSLSGGDSLRLKLDQTWTSAVFDNTFQSGSEVWGVGTINKGDPLPYIPKYQANLIASLSVSDALFSLVGKHISEVYDQSAEYSYLKQTDSYLSRQSIPTYTIIDFSTYYKLSDANQLRFSIDNVTDKAYSVSLAPFGSRPGKPRSVILGLKSSY